MRKLASLLNVILVLSLIVTGCGSEKPKPGIQGLLFYTIDFKLELKLPAKSGFGARDIQVDANNKTAYVIGEFDGTLVKVDLNLNGAKKVVTTTVIATGLFTPTALTVNWTENQAYITREGEDYTTEDYKAGKAPPKRWNVLTSVSLTDKGRRNYVLANSKGDTLKPWQPVGMARGKSDRLYIADVKGERLIGVDLTKLHWWVIQPNVPDIRAVAVDTNEEYVYYTTSVFTKTIQATGGLYRVKIKDGWKVEGSAVITITNTLRSPAGITLSDDGKKIYIAEFGRESKQGEQPNTEGQLSIVSLTGGFPAKVSVVGKDTTKMNTPHGVRVDEKTGVMYGVQVESHKLLIFD